MRKAISVSALLLALTCSAYAGEIQNGLTSAPLSAVQQEQAADGEIQNGLTEIVLGLLGSVLALL